MATQLRSFRIKGSLSKNIPYRSIYTTFEVKNRNIFKRSTLLGSLISLAGGVVLMGRAFAKEEEGKKDCVVCNISEASGPNKIPNLKLYQYKSCPFCCKVRAFLEYYGIQYDTVEVNPLFKKELQFSTYKKVPVLLAGDDQLNDSSLILSVLRSWMVGTGTITQTMDLYPEMSFQDERGKEMVERVNRYFIMFGDAEQIAERKEEREWRQWVDDRLVHRLAPNLYRTLSEAVSAMDYISSAGNFNFFERITAKYYGAVAMYFLSKRLKKKYGLKDDVRLSLYECVDEWLDAIGPHRKYMGGEVPNLADLSVYGVLTSIEGEPVFKDVLLQTKIEPWYREMALQVNQHKGRNIDSCITGTIKPK